MFKNSILLLGNFIHTLIDDTLHFNQSYEANSPLLRISVSLQVKAFVHVTTNTLRRHFRLLRQPLIIASDEHDSNNSQELMKQSQVLTQRICCNV